MTSTNSWSLSITADANKSFGKLDKPVQQKITKFFEERILPSHNPRQLGKQLKGNLSQYWSYGIGDYRVICEFIDNQLVILVVGIGHRRDIYDAV